MLEINKMLTISTRHISMETADFLNAEAEQNLISIVVYPKSKYGWFIPISEAACNKNIPDDLRQVIQFALDLKCQWLCFDRDGLEVPYLKVYDWN